METCLGQNNAHLLRNIKESLSQGMLLTEILGFPLAASLASICMPLWHGSNHLQLWGSFGRLIIIEIPMFLSHWLISPVNMSDGHCMGLSWYECFLIDIWYHDYLKSSISDGALFSWQQRGFLLLSSKLLSVLRKEGGNIKAKLLIW